jgi:hypothetical protein
MLAKAIRAFDGGSTWPEPMSCSPLGPMRQVFKAVPLYWRFAPVE